MEYDARGYPNLGDVKYYESKGSESGRLVSTVLCERDYFEAIEELINQTRYSMSSSLGVTLVLTVKGFPDDWEPYNPVPKNYSITIRAINLTHSANLKSDDASLTTPPEVDSNHLS